MTTNEQVELAVLTANLAAGTCVGEPASVEQQVIRVARIIEIQSELTGRE